MYSQGTVLFLKASSFRDRFVNIVKQILAQNPCFISTRTTDVHARPSASRLAAQRGLPGGERGGGPAFLF